MSSEAPPTPPEPTEAPPTEARTLKGSCHCQYITYTADIELPSYPSHPKASRCNCTLCVKTGWTSLQLAKGKDSFHLKSPDSLEDDGIVKCASKAANGVSRYFCGKCGVTVCAGGWYEMPAAAAPAGVEGEVGVKGEGEDEKKGGGTKVHFFAVNVGTLDQPQDGLDLSVIKMQYWDGKNDNWMAGPKDVPWEGGVM